MVNSMVERATSSMLIGPDWAMNLEICDICKNNPAQAKDAVKGIKKRLRSKNSKVQLLALTLLETIMKNCGDIVHMHVADKELPHEMVKIVKKKLDYPVKEKILILIDTWQEAFGGSRARYPQYFLAYQELLRLGAVIPQRSETTAPVFTPLQTHPLASYPKNCHKPEQQDAAESSAEAEFPTLSLTEIQNARGIMDVLAEMLLAVSPDNKEGLKQDVFVDLVEQCRTYKHRVVHLVNSTADESLLCQGLALNDDLQRLLAKHESLASAAKSAKPELSQPLVNANAPLIDTTDENLARGSTTSDPLGTQLLLPAPPATDDQLATASTVDSKMDLLSWDGPESPKEKSLALVPVGDPQPLSPVSPRQNALSLVVSIPQNNSHPSSNSTGQAYPWSPCAQQQTMAPSSLMLPHYEQSIYSPGSASPWNPHMLDQQQPASPVYGAQNGYALPPPPWEVQLDNIQPTSGQPQQLHVTVTQVVVNQSPPQSPGSTYHPPGSPGMRNDQAGGAYIHPNTSNLLAAISNHSSMPSYPMVGGGSPTPPSVGMYPQQMQCGQMGGYMYPQQMYGNQMPGYGHGYGYGYGYGQPPNGQILEQGMTGLSLRDDGALRNTPYVPPGKPLKPADKLFGDLVDISKFKPVNTVEGRAGSM